MKLAKLNNNPEIFHSIQGEGKSFGRPSIFVRLSLCNLYCKWCDTDYTWNWESTKYVHDKDVKPGYKKYKKNDFIVKLNSKEIIDRIKLYDCENIIITGGEPMVQHKELTPFLKLLKSTNEFYRIEIETNGTITPNSELDSLIDQYNVSIKLSNSGVSENHRLVHDCINFFALSQKTNFKFVVNSINDLNEILSLKERFEIPNNKIYLMPQGITSESLKTRQQEVIEICKKYNFNYTDRIHIHVYGDKRGV